MRGYIVVDKSFFYHIGDSITLSDDQTVLNDAIDCFHHGVFDPTNIVLVVSLEDDSNDVEVISEISWYELLKLSDNSECNHGYGNSGNYNTGNRNTGDYNSGYRNTGDRNSGNKNTGKGNSGNRNTGSYNVGNYNTGDHNIGDDNVGNYNIGDFNIGDFNIGSYNIGDFNLSTATLTLFDKKTNIPVADRYKITGLKLIKEKLFQYSTEWIYAESMTEAEKENNPDYIKTNGYLRVSVYDMEKYKNTWMCMWEHLTEEEKKSIYNIPNFDPKIFYTITGVLPY